jgi:hypothetical protein
MRGDASIVGPRRSEDDPGRDGPRVPAALLRDLDRQSPAPIHSPHEFADVDQFRLELDDQERPSSRMPEQEGRLLRAHPRSKTRLRTPSRRRGIRERALSIRSRSAPRPRGCSSTRISSGAQIRRMESRVISSTRPRSARHTVVCDRPAFAARSACRHRRLSRAARIAVPNPRSSIARIVTIDAYLARIWNNVGPSCAHRLRQILASGVLGTQATRIRADARRRRRCSKTLTPENGRS